MNTALDLVQASPTSSTFIFASPHGASARSAANAQIAFAKKRMCWQPIAIDVLPQIARSPVEQRVDLVETVGLLFNSLSNPARCRLVATNAADPGIGTR